MNNTPNTRLDEWTEFSKIVHNHILSYANGQYGEKGSDQSTFYTGKEIINQIEKYTHRYGKNAREGQQLLDFVKMAHYACIGYWKDLENKEDNTQKRKNDIILDTLELLYSKIESKDLTIETQNLYNISKGLLEEK